MTIMIKLSTKIIASIMILVITLFGCNRQCRNAATTVSAHIEFDSVGQIFILPATVPADAWSEGPLVAVPHIPRYYISTAWTMGYDLSPGKTILNDANAFDLTSGHWASASDLISENWPPTLKNTQTYWRHSYYGIYGAHVATNPWLGKDCIVGILHGENKNMKHWYNADTVYNNTVMPPQTFRFPQDYGGADRVPASG